MYKNTKAKTICNTETPRSTITRLIRFLDCVLHLLYGSAPPKIPSCGNGRKLRSCHIYAGSFRTKKDIYSNKIDLIGKFWSCFHFPPDNYYFLHRIFLQKIYHQKRIKLAEHINALHLAT